MSLQYIEIVVVHTYTIYLLTVSADKVLHRWVEVMATYSVALWFCMVVVRPSQEMSVRIYYVVAPATVAYTVYALATYVVESPEILILMYYYLLAMSILCMHFLTTPRILLEEYGVYGELR